MVVGDKRHVAKEYFRKYMYSYTTVNGIKEKQTYKKKNSRSLLQKHFADEKKSIPECIRPHQVSVGT